ncbi:MAG: uracil-DNA glycosylase, partial [Chloroflexi bacterium]|nr:uracil-DNA glycosylase [Chloroflexota bacterium]
MEDSHRKQLASLTDEIVACRMCTRLVDWREKIGQEKRASY